MISMYQLMITIGILGAYLSDTAFSYSGAWRWMLGVIIIPAVLLLIGVIFLPDSPRWFAAKRRFVDARTRAAAPARYQRRSETRAR